MEELITIYCKNTNQYYDVPIGSSLLDIYKVAGEPLRLSPMNAQVNNKTEDLTFRCWHPKDVEFIDITNPSGMRTYVRSLCFILSKAVYDISPNATLNLEHSISKGYYCTIQDEKPFDEERLNAVKTRMEEIIKANVPFHLYTKQTNVVCELFRKQGLDDKANLVESCGQLYTSYYEMDGFVNYFYGSLVPSTGYIHLFGLEPYHNGALLRVPNPANPSALAPFVNQDKMYQVYKNQLDLQKALGMSNVGDLNKALEQGMAHDVILVSEAIQEKQISRIAEDIAARYANGVRVVLIAGPSSSGKTTTCKRLQVQLAANRLHPVGISLDDYFLNREDTPRDESGDYDYESLYALDLPYFNNDLKRLIAGEEVELPSFDFPSGHRVYKGNKLKLRENSIIVIEGIHGLNPELTADIDESLKFRIYVSALTSISLDNHNWIPTTDNRLLRRIIRDYQFRGSSAEATIARWQSVRRGEDKWIFPYQENADVMFNSAMLYELAALRAYSEPILSNVPENSPSYSEAYRLLRFLRYFKYIPKDELPKTSLLCEFLGGGTFKY